MVQVPLYHIVGGLTVLVPLYHSCRWLHNVDSTVSDFKVASQSSFHFIILCLWEGRIEKRCS